jgi:hypothetical protein
MSTGGICSECGNYASVIFRKESGEVGYGICIPCVAPQVRSVSLEYTVAGNPPMPKSVTRKLDEMRGRP